MTTRLDEQAILWPRGAHEPGRPLLVLLHGLGANEHDLVPLAPALPEGMTVASVRAPMPAPPGWAWMQTEPPIERIVAQVDAGADALAEWALRAAGGDPVVLLGFSQGGATTVDAVRRWPGAFAAAVSLAGFLVGSDRAGAAAAPPTPLFVGHGTADDVVPLSWNEMLLEWAREHTELEQHRYPGVAHAVSEDQLRDVSAFLSTVF